jgi:hypothetical protein
MHRTRLCEGRSDSDCDRRIAEGVCVAVRTEQPIPQALCWGSRSKFRRSSATVRQADAVAAF